MRFSEIKAIIREWIFIAIPKMNDYPDQVIFANENGPRPNLPYFTINITASSKIGHVNRIETDAVGIQRSKIDNDISVSIQCFGKQSADLLVLLRNSLQKESVLLFFDENRLVIRDDTQITNIALQVDKTIEKRYLYELMIGSSEELFDDVGFIESVTFDPTYIGPDGQEINP